MLPRVFYKTVYLDQIFSRNIQIGNHWIGSTFRAWKVVGTNNENFKLRIVPDGKTGAVEGYELEDTPIHNLTDIANEGVFENDQVQAGVWVRIMFTTEDSLIYAGSKSGGGVISTIDGTNFSSERVDVQTVVTEIIPANDKRVKASIQHKMGGSFWVGNPSELNDPDFKNICHEVRAGESLEWKNFASLSAKGDAVVILSVVQEVI